MYERIQIWIRPARPLSHAPAGPVSPVDHSFSFFSPASIASVTCFESGLTAGSNRATTSPFTNKNLVKFLTGLDVLFDSVADRARADHAERAAALDRAKSRACYDLADVALDVLSRVRAERAGMNGTAG
jgi:hypothetical protein